MSEPKNNKTPLVYSTAHGRVCAGCGKPVTGCSCKKKVSIQAGDGVVRIGRETKGRKGKGVTIISGVPLDHSGLLALGKDLKKRCGSGGTVKEGTIEIQGDHRDMLFEELQKRGWRVKRSGG
jgi:translation initiation factor 1